MATKYKPGSSETLADSTPSLQEDTVTPEQTPPENTDPEIIPEVAGEENTNALLDETSENNESKEDALLEDSNSNEEQPIINTDEGSDLGDLEIKDSDEGGETPDLETENESPITEEEPEMLPTITDVMAIITDSELTVSEKSAILETCGLPTVEMLVTTINVYIENMGNASKLVTPDVGASNNFNLFTRIVSACSTEDKALFKVHFHIINMLFTEHANAALKDINLMRFDEKWKWGTEKLVAYRHLMTLICSLANITTRGAAIKKISIGAALDKSKTGFSNILVDNIKAYYEA